MNEGKSDIEMIMPLSDLIVDFLTDSRIPYALRREYLHRVDKVAPYVGLLSYDYIKEKNRG